MSDVKTRDWLMIALLGFVWGGTFLVMEIALRGITPYWLAAARIGFAATVTGFIWALRGFPLFLDNSPRPWGSIILASTLTSALPFILLSWGLQHVTSGFAGVSMSAVGLMVLPLAHFLVQGDQMNLRKTLGFLLGFAGVVVLIGGQAFNSTGASLETMGRLACLAAAICYAVSSIIIRRLPPIDPLSLAALLLIIGTAIVIPAAYIAEGPPPVPDPKTITYLVILGLIPTAAANSLRVFIIRSAGPTFMSLTGYQVPIWSVLLGAYFLNEPLPGSLLFAMVMILSGIAISQWPALYKTIFLRQKKSAHDDIVPPPG